LKGLTVAATATVVVMATTLPAINASVSKQPSYGVQHQLDLQLQPPPSLPPDKAVLVNVSKTQKIQPMGPPKIAVRQLMNRKEQEWEQRMLASRAKLPNLSERQTAEFKNSYKHTLCASMLERGFHRSFREIFELIKQQADRRLIAGPDSTLWNQCPLEDEHEKLDMMKEHLVAAESAMLLGDYVRVYQSHHQLAKYFQSTGDKWLSDHFFQNCLHYSANVKEDEGKIAADGHCNVAASLEEAGNLTEAANNFELCYSLTKGKSDWLADDGKTLMHNQSCNNLARIYTSIASQYRVEKDHETSLKYLTRAYEMSKEGGDRKLFGEASYQLGLAYVENGDADTALTHLQNYFETCQALKDGEGIGKACEAIARAHDSQGHVEESIRYLQKFIQVSEDSKDDTSLSHACNSLGIRFNCLGEYKRAFDNFSRAYNISRTLNDTPVLQLSRVLSGTAHAHEMLRNYTRHVNAPSSRTSLTRLLDWKDNRGDEFDRPLSPPKAAATPDRVPPLKQSSVEKPLPAASALTPRSEGGTDDHNTTNTEND
jgi:tetratricopeptide (TPR) repeat protein